MTFPLLPVAVATILAIQLTQLFMPTIYDVRTGDVDKVALRKTEYVALGLIFVAGVLAGMAEKSHAPILSSLVAAIIIYVIYEWALRNPVGQ